MSRPGCRLIYSLFAILVSTTVFAGGKDSPDERSNVSAARQINLAPDPASDEVFDEAFVTIGAEGEARVSLGSKSADGKPRKHFFLTVDGRSRTYRAFSLRDASSDASRIRAHFAERGHQIPEQALSGYLNQSMDRANRRFGASQARALSRLREFKGKHSEMRAGRPLYKPFRAPVIKSSTNQRQESGFSLDSFETPDGSSPTLQYGWCEGEAYSDIRIFEPAELINHVFGGSWFESLARVWVAADWSRLQGTGYTWIYDRGGDCQANALTFAFTSWGVNYCHHVQDEGQYTWRLTQLGQMENWDFLSDFAIVRVDLKAQVGGTSDGWPFWWYEFSYAASNWGGYWGESWFLHADVDGFQGEWCEG